MKRLLLLALVVLVLVPTTGTYAATKRHIAFGDSISDGFGDPEGTGYPRRLKRILQKETEDDIQVVKGDELIDAKLTVLPFREEDR